jgi:hypothetical protein
VPALQIDYSASMENLPIPYSGKLLLIAAPRAFLREALPALIARLSLAGPLRIVDGGNSFNFHAVARHVRRQSSDLQLRLQQIQIARAFTCYQVLSLLAETPADAAPTLVIDLLTTFYDENVNQIERRSLLAKSLTHLQRINALAPVAVSANTPAPGAQDEWFTMLEACAGQTWSLQAPEYAAQLHLF